MKGEFGITRTFYKFINLRLQTEAGFSFGEKSVHFLDFVLGGYGFNTINNFKPFYGYDFLSIAADSYIKSLATVDVEFYKKTTLTFRLILPMQKISYSVQEIGSLHQNIPVMPLDMA